MSTKDRIQAILNRFAALHDRDIDLGLGRMHELLHKLGDPHLSLPPVIHVAGTNGKGSTIALIRAMAEANGLVTHVHTSPHLIALNERYVLAGQQISDDGLLALLQEVETANDGARATQFELLSAAMFVAFSRTPADLALIEVGLGGELDATNVLPAPVLSLITPISVEHTDWLGDDLAGIAAAKAGIIKPNCPVLSAAQADPARDVLIRTAARNRAPIQFGSEDFSCHLENGRLVWQDEMSLLDLPLPTLAGTHQIENAALAIAAARHLNWPQSSIAKGLQNAHWPGRLQAISHLPPIEPQVEIWLDGAHNPHAAKALSEFLHARQRANPAKLEIILALQASKDLAAFLEPLRAFAPQFHVVPLPTAPAPIAPEVLANAICEQGFLANSYKSLQAALAAIPGGQTRLVLTGSLYLAGDVLALTPTKTPA
jgi:dihydrofolate synthase/folylpolyglutamate synthase